MTDLQTLTYVSSATALFDTGALYALLDQSRQNNVVHGITGLLLYADGTFMQTIEGARLDIDRLFANIVRDPRHHGVIKLIHDDLDARLFPAWSMGFRHGDKAVDGFTSYLDADHGLTLHGPMDSYAKQLFVSFKQGLNRKS
jgi:hypothetical protein